MKKIKFCFIDDDTLREKEIEFSDENEELAKNEAYSGEYEIFDDGEPAPEPTEEEQLRADVDFLLMLAEEDM